MCLGWRLQSLSLSDLHWGLLQEGEALRFQPEAAGWITEDGKNLVKLCFQGTGRKGAANLVPSGRSMCGKLDIHRRLYAENMENGRSRYSEEKDCRSGGRHADLPGTHYRD